MRKYLLVFAALLIAVSAYAAVTNLAWDANTESDLAGYKLYQSTTAGGPYTFVREVDQNTLTAATADLPDGTYFFVVTAFDTFGNESGYSNEVSKTDDTTPPAPPQNFRLVP